MANVELFKKIRDQIKSVPMSFNMGTWSEDLAAEIEIDGDWDHEYYDANTGEWAEAPASECGTTRCVAGWAIHFEAERLGLDVNRPLIHVAEELAGVLGVQNDYEEVAMRVLDIDYPWLFFKDEEDAFEIVNEYAEGLRS